MSRGDHPGTAGSGQRVALQNSPTGDPYSRQSTSRRVTRQRARYRSLSYSVGDRYSTIQVKLVEQSLPDDSRKPETAAPGGTRFANYAKSDIYFRCPAQLVETKVMRGKFDAPSVVG